MRQLQTQIKRIPLLSYQINSAYFTCGKIFHSYFNYSLTVWVMAIFTCNLGIFHSKTLFTNVELRDCSLT